MPERGATSPQYLADQLTLFQMGKRRLSLPITTPPIFFTFQHHCSIVFYFRLEFSCVSITHGKKRKFKRQSLIEKIALTAR